MIARLRNRSRLTARTAPAVPPRRRIYAVGDIHGSLGVLLALLRLIKTDIESAPGQYPVVVYLGDYIDRGLQSREVIDCLLDTSLPAEEIFLMGNHEEGLLRFLVDPIAASAWVAYGGIPTIFSYGVRPPAFIEQAADLERVRSELTKKIPRRHLDFLSRLKTKHIEGDYVFVHAGLRPGISLEQQSTTDLLWIRGAFLNAEEEFEKFVVHGHSIADKPQVRPNRIGIDTGAFVSGRLTCLVLEGADRRFLST